MNIKVISYNILSPFLCNDAEFIAYNHSHIDRNLRKQTLFNLLKGWIKDLPIICLQEISFNWKGEIEAFFYKNDYKIFIMNYGHKGNGFFGIGIAVPNKYDIIATEYLHIGNFITANPPEHIFNWEDQKRQVKRNKEREGLSFVDKLSSYMEEIVESKEEQIQEIDKTIQEAKNRNNFAICLTLCEKDIEDSKKFKIFTYHMPCTFRKPIIQSLHVDAIKKIIYKNKDIPTIFAGDFNVTPESIGYDYLTSGILPDEHRIYIPVNNHSNLELKSALKSINSTEPNFTCFSNTKFGGEFKDTLDYIFYYGPFTVTEAERLILSSTKIPNQNNPSDHLPIYANFQL